MKSRLRKALRRFVPRHVVSSGFAVRLFGAGVVAVLASTFAFSQGVQARNSDVYALGDDFYKSIHERNFVLRTEPNEITSSQQLRDMIYNRFSSMVLEQTTGSVRRYGQQFFGDGFRMRSNIGWDVTEGFRGDLELGVPLLPKSIAGHNFALQFQPGLILWTGHREQERLDINLGLVARYRVGRDSPLAFGRPSLIYGANIFYDINTDNSLDRLGLGVDMQARRLMLAVNAYIALDDDWQDGDDGYQERAVSGFELRAQYDFLTNAQLRASLGGWENTDVNATGSDFDDYSFSATVGGNWYFHPNFAVSGDYEYGGYGLGDSRFTIGVQARWPGKRLGRNRGTRVMDLYALVEREQRILYAERRSSSVVVTAGMIGQSDIVETDGSTDMDVSFTLELSRLLAAAGAAADGNTAAFDVYTSVAADDIGAGNTAAGASDYVAIGDPQASGEQTSPAPVAAAGTCAAATPRNSANPCQLRIVPGTSEGTLTITGLVLGDDVEEEAEYFAVKFKPTTATRARFGLPEDFATAVVRILPSDPTRTIELTFQETVAQAPATSGGASPLPVRVTLSKALVAPVTIDVVLIAQIVVSTQQGPIRQGAGGQQAIRAVQATRTVERECRIPVTLESGEMALQETVDVSQCFAANQFDVMEGEFVAATVTLELPPKKLPPRDDEGEEDGESAGEVFDLDGDNKVNGVPLAKDGDAGAGEKQKLKPTGAKAAQAKIILARPAANKRRVTIAAQYDDGETAFAEPNADGTQNFHLTLSGTGAVPTGTRVRYEIVHIDTVAADVAVVRARTAASQAGASFIALPVTIKADDLAENTEAFGIKVTEVSEGGSGTTIDQTLFEGRGAPGYTATALIAANDRRMVRLASTTLAATETDADIEIDLTARLSGVLADDLVLSLTAAPGTAVAADYTVPAGLTIDAGDASGTAELTIAGDELAEGTESFTIAVRYPSRLPEGVNGTARASGLVGTVTVTITDDDEPAKLVLYEQVGNTAGDNDDVRLGDAASVAEAGNAGDNGKKLYYRLETGADDVAQASRALSIALASGSVSVSAPVTVATEPAHFAIAPKALTIAAGESISSVFTLTTVDDNGEGADSGPNKNDRQFGLTPSVSNAPGWLATPTASTVTITDDDGKSRIEVQAGKALGGGNAAQSTLNLGEVAEGDTLTLSFKLTRQAEGTNVEGISFALAVTDTNSDLGDLSAASVTLTNADNAGPSGTAKEVTLEVTDDALAEGDETFTIAVSSIAATGTSPSLENFGSGTSTGTASITFTVPANDLATLTFSIANALAEPADAGSQTAVNMRMESSAELGTGIEFSFSGLNETTPASASVFFGGAIDARGSGATDTFDGKGSNNGRTNIGAVTVLADNLAEGDETFIFENELGGSIRTNTLGAAFTSANAAGKVEILLKRLGLTAANTHLYKVGSAAASATDVAFRIRTSGRNTLLVAELTMTIPANDTIAKVGLFDANPTGTAALTPLTALTLEEAADATDLWVALLDADNKLVRASATVSVAIPTPRVTGGTNEGQLTITTSPVRIPAAAGKAKFTIAAAADGGSNNEDDGTATLTATAGTIPAGEKADTVAAASVSITVNDKEGKPRITMQAAASGGANKIVSGGAKTSISAATHSITVKEGAGTLTLTLGLSKAFRTRDRITSVTVTPKGSLEDDSTISEDDFENDGITSTAATLKGDATDTGTLVYKIKNDDIAEGTETAKFELAITSAGTSTLSTSIFGTPTTVELNIIVQANDSAKLTFALPAALAEGSDATPTLTSDKVIETNASPNSGRSPIIFGGRIALQATTPTASAADIAGADRDVGIKTAISNALLANTRRERSLNLAVLTIEDDTLAEGAETFLYRVPLGVSQRAADYANAASLMQYNGLDTDVSEHKFTVADTAQAGALAFKRVTSGNNAQLWAEITMTIPANDTIAKLLLFNSDPGAAGDTVTDLTDTLTVEEAADSDVWVAMLDSSNKIVTSTQNVDIGVALSGFTTSGREGAVTLTGVTAGKATITSGNASATFKVAAAADGSTSNEADNSGTLTASVSTTLTAGTAVTSVPDDTMAVAVNDKEGKARITIEAASSVGANQIVSGGAKTSISAATHSITVKEGAGTLTLTLGLSRAFRARDNITSVTVTPGSLETDSTMSTGDFESGGIESDAVTLKGDASDTGTLEYKIKNDAIAEDTETAKFDLTITKAGAGTLGAGIFGTPTTVELNIIVQANDLAALTFSIASALAEPATTAGATAENVRVESSAAFGTAIAFASLDVFASTPVSATVTGTGDDVNGSGATGTFDGTGANNGRTNIGSVTVLADNLAEADETFVFRVRLGESIVTSTLGRAFISANAQERTAILLTRLGLADFNSHFYKAGSAQKSGLGLVFASQSRTVNSVNRTSLVASITMTIPANDAIAKVGLFDANPTGTGVQAPLTELTLEEAADATDLWVALLDADNKLARASVPVTVSMPTPTVTGGTREGQLTFTNNPARIPAAAGKAKFTIKAAADGVTSNEVDGTATLTANPGAGAIPNEEKADTVEAASVSITVNDKEGKPRITIEAASSVGASEIVSGGAKTAISTATHTITVKEGVGTLTLTLGLSKAFRTRDRITSVTVTPKGSLEDDSAISEDDFESDGITSTAVTLKGDATDTGTLVYKIKDDDIAEDTETAKFELAITKAGAGTLKTSNFGTPTTVELNIIVQANDLAKLTFALPAALAEGSDATPTMTSDKVIDTDASPSSGRSAIIYGANIALKATTPTASAADVVGADATDRDVGIKTAISNATFADTSGNRSLNLAVLVVEDDTLAEGAETFLYRVPVGVPQRAADYANAASLMQYNGLDTDVSQHKFEIASTAQAGALAFKRVESGSNVQLWAEITMTIPANDTIAKLLLFNSDPGAAGDTVTDLTDTLEVEEAADSDVWVALLDSSNKIVTLAQDVDIGVVLEKDFTTTGNEGAVTLTGVTNNQVVLTAGGASATFKVAAAADTGRGNTADNEGTLQALLVASQLPAGTLASLVVSDTMAVAVHDKQIPLRITMQASVMTATDIVSGGARTAIRGNTSSSTDSADYALSVKEGVGAITLTFSLSNTFSDSTDIDGITITPGAIRTATQLRTGAADTAVRADFASGTSGVPTAAVTVDNTDRDTATLVYRVNNDALIESDELAVFPLTITKKDGSGGTLTDENFGTPETINLKITVLASDAGQIQFEFVDRDDDALGAGYVLGGEAASESPNMFVGSSNIDADRPRTMPTTVSVVDGTARAGDGKDYTFKPTNGGVVNLLPEGSAIEGVIFSPASVNAITILDDNEAEAAETFKIRVQIGDTTASGVTLTNTDTLANTVAALRTARVEQHLGYYGFIGPIQESLDEGSNYTNIGTGGSKLLIAGGQLIYERTITIPANDAIAKVGLFNSDPGAAGTTVTDLTDTLEVLEADDSDVWVAMLDSGNKIVTTAQNVEIGVALSGFRTSNREGAVTLTGVTAGKATITSGNASATFKVAAAADTGRGNAADNSGTLTASVSSTLGDAAIASVPDDTMAVTVTDQANTPRLQIEAAATPKRNIVSGRAKTAITGNTNSGADSTDYALSVTEGVGAITLTFGLSTVFGGSADIDGITITPGAIRTATQLRTGAADTAVRADFASGTSGVPTAAVTVDNTDRDTATLVYRVNNDALVESDEVAVFPLTITKKSGSGGTLTATNFATPETINLKITILANDAGRMQFELVDRDDDELGAGYVLGGETASESPNMFVLSSSFADRPRTMPATVSVVDGTARAGDGKDYTFKPTNGGVVNVGAEGSLVANVIFSPSSINTITIVEDAEAEAAETFKIRVQIGDSSASGVTLTNTDTLANTAAALRTARVEQHLGYYGFRGPIQESLDEGSNYTNIGTGGSKLLIAGGQLIYERTITIPKDDTIAKVLLFNSDPGAAGTTVTDLTDTLEVEEAADSDVWVAMLDSGNKIVTSAQDVDIGLALSGFRTSNREGAVTLTGVTAGKATIMSGAASATFKVAAAADGSASNVADNSGTLTASVSSTLTANTAIASVPDDTMAVTVSDEEGRRRLRMQASATTASNIVSGGASTGITGNTDSATDSTDYALSVTEGVGAITFTFTLPKAFGDSADIEGLTITPGAIRTATQLRAAAADTAVRADFASGTSGVPTAAVTIDNTDGDTATLVYRVNNDALVESDELAVFPLTIAKKSGSTGELTAMNFAAPETINLKITILANDAGQLQFELVDRDDDALGAGYVLGGEAASESPNMFVGSSNIDADRPRTMPATVSVVDGTARAGDGKDYTFKPTNGGVVNVGAEGGLVVEVIFSLSSINTITIIEDVEAEAAETFKIRVQIGDTTASGVTLTNAASLTNTAAALRTARVEQHLGYYGYTGPIQESLDEGSNYTNIGTGGSKLLIAGGQLFYERTITIPKDDTIAKVLLFNSDPGAAGTTVTDLTDTLEMVEEDDSDVWVAMLDADNKIVTSAQDVDIGLALSGFRTSNREGAVTLTGVTAGKATITSGNASATFKVAAAADTGRGNVADNSGTLTASVSSTLTANTAIARVPDDTMAVAVEDKQAPPRIMMQASVTTASNIVSGGAKTAITGNTNSATDSTDYALSVKEGVGAITFTFSLNKLFGGSADIDGITITPGALAAADSTAVAADFVATTGIPTAAVTVDNMNNAMATLVYTVNDDNVIEGDELAVLPLTITKKDGSGGRLTATSFGTPETINLKITILVDDKLAYIRMYESAPTGTGQQDLAPFGDARSGLGLNTNEVGTYYVALLDANRRLLTSSVDLTIAYSGRFVTFIPATSVTITAGNSSASFRIWKRTNLFVRNITFQPPPTSELPADRRETSLRAYVLPGF